MFLETSALTGENVEEAFLKCARNILTKIESGRMFLSLGVQKYNLSKIICVVIDIILFFYVIMSHQLYNISCFRGTRSRENGIRNTIWGRITTTPQQTTKPAKETGVLVLRRHTHIINFTASSSSVRVCLLHGALPDCCSQAHR